MKKQLKDKKGYTLIEVMVTVTIIAILTAVAMPSFINVIKNSENSSRNNTAKTIFLAAQTAMTDAYNSGEDASIVDDGMVDLSTIVPDVSSEELDDNSSNIAYLSLDKNSLNKENNSVYKLLKPYISDNIILEGSIIIEYNRITSNVFCVFYSDVVGSLGYNAFSEYDVTNRYEENLTNGKVGYYGVETTGKKPENPELGDVSVELVDYTGEENQGNNINEGKNYGLFTAECFLPTNITENTRFQLTIYPQSGDKNVLSFVNGVAEEKQISLQEVRANLTLDQAMQNPFTVTSYNGIYQRKVCAYIDGTINGKELLVVVLDCPIGELSITRNYKNLGTDNIIATFSIFEGTDRKTAYSNTKSVLFGDRIKVDGQPYYTVASVRHLNNIRYNVLAKFVQVADFACTDYNERPLFFKPINDAVNEAEKSFKGVYKGVNGENDYKIYNLTINNEQNTGLFETVSQIAVIEGIRLDYTQEYITEYEQAQSDKKSSYFISGTANVAAIASTNNGNVLNSAIYNGIVDARGENSFSGGIVAINNGTVQNCTSFSKVLSTDTGVAGGICAKNENTAVVTKSLSIADVTAGLASGGIVGQNFGNVSYCEAGTASAVDNNGKSYFAGICYFGADGDTQNYKYKPQNTTIKNDVYTVTATQNNANAGGICGENLGTGTISYCVNALKVVANNGDSGGITGKSVSTNQNSINKSYNAGSVVGGKRAGGISGYITGKVLSSYNTGYINVNAIYSQSEGGYVVNQQLNSASATGGLVGYGTSTSQIYDCYSIQYAGNKNSGAFGIMSGEISNCAFFQNKQNTESSFRVSDSSYDESDNLSMLTLEEIRETSFAGMQLGNTAGIGEFLYKSPYLNISDSSCSLGEKFHRTPYTLPIGVEQEVSSIIWIEQDDELISVSFLTNEEQARMVLKTDTTNITVYFTEWTFDVLKYYEKYWDIPVWKLTGYGDDGRVYNFYGQAIKLDPSSEYYKDGYEYMFKTYMRWESVYGGIADVLLDSTTLYAELYEYPNNGKLLATSNEITKPVPPPEDIVFVYKQYLHDMTAIGFYIPKDYNVSSINVKLYYYDKHNRTQVINLPINTFLNAPVGYETAVGNTKYYLTTGSSNTKRYPFYKNEVTSYPGYDEYTIVLLSEELGNSGYNGLRKDPFYVELVINGQTYYSDWYEGVDKKNW